LIISRKRDEEENILFGETFRSPPPEQEKEFDQALVRYLIFYNTQRCHKIFDKSLIKVPFIK
jgi:hypothetical protein